MISPPSVLNDHSGEDEMHNSGLLWTCEKCGRTSLDEGQSQSDHIRSHRAAITARCSDGLHRDFIRKHHDESECHFRSRLHGAVADFPPFFRAGFKCPFFDQGCTALYKNAHSFGNHVRKCSWGLKAAQSDSERKTGPTPSPRSSITASETDDVSKDSDSSPKAQEPPKNPAPSFGSGSFLVGLLNPAPVPAEPIVEEQIDPKERAPSPPVLKRPAPRNRHNSQPKLDIKSLYTDSGTGRAGSAPASETGSSSRAMARRRSRLSAPSINRSYSAQPSEYDELDSDDDTYMNAGSGGTSLCGDETGPSTSNWQSYKCPKCGEGDFDSASRARSHTEKHQTIATMSFSDGVRRTVTRENDTMPWRCPIPGCKNKRTGARNFRFHAQRCAAALALAGLPATSKSSDTPQTSESSRRTSTGKSSSRRTSTAAENTIAAAVTAAATLAPIIGPAAIPLVTAVVNTGTTSRPGTADGAASSTVGEAAANIVATVVSVAAEASTLAAAAAVVETVAASVATTGSTVTSAPAGLASDMSGAVVTPAALEPPAVVRSV